MSKRKSTATAEATTASTDNELVTHTAEPPKPSHAAEQDALVPVRDPGLRREGDDTKSWVKQSTASVIVDPDAGMKFHFDYEKHKAIITFDEKPTPEVLAVARPILNAGGYEWDRDNKDGWKKKILFQQREEDRRQAKKTFYNLANAIREHKGLPARSFGEAMAF